MINNNFYFIANKVNYKAFIEKSSDRLLSNNIIYKIN